jgi:predicted metal-dependent phosphoesterase TrpH
MSLPPGSVDLHTHTRHSDGLDTPAELVAKCARHGVRRLAITDHDTLGGLPEACTAGETLGVEVFTGIELSVQHGDFQDIHLLGYFFDPQDVSLNACLARLQEGRTQRGLEILRRVNGRLGDLGLSPLSEDCVRQHAAGVLTRPHLAQALVDQGYCRDHQDAFRDFLVPCNAPKPALPLEEGIRLVTQAGGVCSLAHPGVLSNDPNVLDPLLATARSLGLAGLEVYHRAQHPNDIPFFEASARRHGLVATGGSDYHGRHNGRTLGEIAPGHPVPVAVLDHLRRVADSRGSQ